MDVMMNAMVARMDALSSMPLGGMISAGLPQGVAPGQMVVRTFTSNGRGSCQQTITYGAGAQQPVVQQVGDACGGVATPRPQATTPAVQPAPVEQRPDQQMYHIDYRHKAAAAKPLHG